MYKRKTRGIWKHIDFLVLDLICVEIAYFIGLFVRNYQLNGYLSLAMNLVFYRKMALALGVVDLLAALILGNYRGIIHRTKFPEMLETFKYVTIVELVFLLYTFVTKNADTHSRGVFLMSWAAALIIDYGARVVWKRIVRRIVTRKSGKEEMLLIVDPDRCYDCIKSIYDKPYRNFEVKAVAFLKDFDQSEDRKQAIEYDEDKNRILSAQIIYGPEALNEYVRQQVVDRVFIDNPSDRKQVNELVDQFLSMGIVVHIGNGNLPENLPNRVTERLGNETVLTTSIQASSGAKLMLKRAFDILGGLVGTIIMLLLCIFVAPAIKIADPGPVFFKQKRMGRNGRSFNMYKFRSMYMDAEERKAALMEENEMHGIMFKMDNDPRIIGSEKGPGKGLGNFIRKTSIDEFPQFINILKGDMSLVGTRPPTMDEFVQYDLHHKVRLSMKPGLTGMWQVSGRSEITDFEEVVRLDAEYVNHWSLLLDIKILFKTVGVVLTGRGSK